MDSRLKSKIEELLSKKERVVLAIDGMCGAGKSTLAKELKEIYQAEVIPMDAFFLPGDLRSEERYATPGGNVHYERFLEEVMNPLIKKEEISYRVFDCKAMDYGNVVTVSKTKLYVIEGTYCMREEFRAAYDLSVFMECSDELQQNRILMRSGKRRLEDFNKKWIPLEKLYFKGKDIKNQCDMVISTNENEDLDKPETYKKSKREILGRSGMAVFGVILAGLSVGFFRVSDFGTDPFTTFMLGLLEVIPLGYGTLYMIINLLMLVLIFIFDKKYIGFATAINIFLLGYVIEFSEKVVRILTPSPDLMLRIIYLIVGVIILCFASALYFTADMGVSTYDAIALMISTKRKWKFKYCRIATDFICVGVGVLLGAIAGVGTIITAFFMGPIISFFREKVSEPFLKNVVKKEKL